MIISLANSAGVLSRVAANARKRASSAKGIRKITGLPTVFFMAMLIDLTAIWSIHVAWQTGLFCPQFIHIICVPFILFNVCLPPSLCAAILTHGFTPQRRIAILCDLIHFIAARLESKPYPDPGTHQTPPGSLTKSLAVST